MTDGLAHPSVVHRLYGNFFFFFSSRNNYFPHSTFKFDSPDQYVLLRLISVFFFSFIRNIVTASSKLSTPCVQLSPPLFIHFPQGSLLLPSYWSAVQHQHAGVSIREPILPICERRAAAFLKLSLAHLAIQQLLRSLKIKRGIIILE